jgi:hypothetical protein
VIRAADRARVLRECAVDLIRAADLENGTLIATERELDRINRVQADLEEIGQQLRDRVLLCSRYPDTAAA